MSWENIPEELRILPQWVGANADKQPIDPHTGRLASVTNPATWGTFEQACSCGAPYLGFVFTKDDPYVFIDLDTGKDTSLTPLHTEIIMHADSYTETSISGTSSHVIVKGTLDQGIKDDNQHIEVYPHSRYCLMTGWLFHGYEIQECQDLIDFLANKIKHKRFDNRIELESEPAKHSDDEIWRMALDAANGEKFLNLFYGEWQNYPEYLDKNNNPDHSRADLGLLTMLDFYTKNVEQAVRIFKYSKLYRPEKGRRGGDGTDYIIRTLRSARVRNAGQEQEVDLSGITKQVQAVLQPKKDTRIPPRPDRPATVFAPGLIGEIANYIMMSSLRPVPEVALMGALAFMAGIVGRQYNIPGSGLNLYLILLAATGTGKEGSGSGIQRLISKVRVQVPMVDQFTGPAEFASGPALIKSLDKQPCFYSLVGEFGMRMQQMVHPRAHSGERTLMRALLNLYSKSGWHQSESSMAYSDKEKNTKTLYAPSLTIFGESTPESFFEGLDEHLVNSGLLPRFLVIEYSGGRPPKNETAAFCDPSPELVDKVTNLVVTVLQMQQNNTCYPVSFDASAKRLLDEFDQLADEKINAGTEVYKQLWNRAHLKALRLAALVAVGNNWSYPIVRAQDAHWAIELVKRDVNLITGRFEHDMVGTSENRYWQEVKRAVVAYTKMTAEQRKKYSVSEKIIQQDGFIPISYLHKRLAQIAFVKQDRRGASRAIKETISDMIDAGILVELPVTQKQQFGIRARVLTFGEAWTI